MSSYQKGSGGVTLADFVKKKQAGEKIAAITCYDAAFAKLLDQTPIDMVLVGDSLGNVILGLDNTLAVTMEHMLHHCRAVASKLTKPFLVVDMPFGSYHTDVTTAVQNALRFVKEAGAQAVKLEGAEALSLDAIRAIVAAGIPVFGHLGLQPQSLHATSGYKVQGRGEAGELVYQQAQSLAAAGVSGLILELVPGALAQRITAALKVPTIGIGAGVGVDGQILVLHDMLGFDDGFCPKFLKQYVNMASIAREAVGSYVDEVKTGTFPTEAQTFV